jgi:hypothetical protein
MSVAIKSVDRILYNGVAVAGCTRTVYLSGTTTKATIYSDAALSVPTSNPLTTDTNGEVAFYAANTSNLRFYDQAPDGTTLIRDLDPVYPVTSLTGLNSTPTELNYLNGVTAGTTTASKALVVDSNKRMDVLTVGTLSLGAGAGTAITSTATELNKLSGCTASTADLNLTTTYLNGLTPGTVTASKAVIVNSAKGIDQIGITKLIDANGNEIIKTASVGSAVNELTAINAITATNPSLAASGDDTNITAEVSGKGTGGVRLKAPGLGAPLKLNKNAVGFDASVDLAVLTNNRTLTIPDQDVNLTPATQAEMETATATDRFVSPGRVQYNPGVAKAWVNFNGRGTIAINTSLNVTSLTDNGVGDWTINLTTAFSSANYAFAGAAKRISTDGGSDVFLYINRSVAPTSSALRVLAGDAAATAQDPEIVCVAMWGDQ